MQRPRPTSTNALSARETLLVLTALVLVVAGSLVLMRHKSRDALRAESARNLMQWSIALQMHLLENNNFLPTVGGATPDPTLESAWYNSLPKYIGLPSPITTLSQAPNGQLDGPMAIWRDPTHDDPLLTPNGAFVFTYGMNRHLHPDISRSAYRIQDLQNPALTVFMTEKSGTDPGMLPQDTRFRHKRAGVPAANVLYCDGHVALVDDNALLSFLSWPDTPTLDGLTTWSPFQNAPDPDWSQIDR